uniref:Uncharacterized protein n=1 Tax=Chromera velia CCMP2878 TaxID=1169474 RepID=A0A0G4I607_9ALVE|eukprot:Cvel_60.t1-p1 / transcript=Cvel_60.t1 / gene=Cvel_60 / organism=Chromera_velia_CCMP2878 / gene_product=hypothetical protein / transcript_product=hypothetical protein / location=Cvel_scaffold6:54327-56148(+) / protein_length=83 / sequence_SO=supercontig / SO=protein_coding / is_pseudo=false
MRRFLSSSVLPSVKVPHKERARVWEGDFAHFLSLNEGPEETASTRCALMAMVGEWDGRGLEGGMEGSFEEKAGRASDALQPLL